MITATCFYIDHCNSECSSCISFSLQPPTADSTFQQWTSDEVRISAIAFSGSALANLQLCMLCRLHCWRSSVSRTNRTQFSGPRWSISSIAALAHAGADGERSGAGCRAHMQSLRPSKLGCMIAKQLLDLVGPFVVTVLLYVLTCLPLPPGPLPRRTKS